MPSPDQRQSAHAAPSLRFAVVGPGALGSLFAARLALSGQDVVLLDHRPERAAALASAGITVISQAGEEHASLPVTADPAFLRGRDVAIVLVKAYHTEAVAATLDAHLHPSSVALTLQNGLGNYEILDRYLGADRVLAGATAQGALLEEPGRVRDTGTGPTQIGVTVTGQPWAEDVAPCLAAAGFPVSFGVDRAAPVWRKAIVNAALNAVTALTRLTNGGVAARADLLDMMVAAAEEAACVARRSHVHLAVEDWRAVLQGICRATATNTNSMLADVMAGRRTEIAAINGEIVARGRLHRVRTPINAALLALVRALEPAAPSAPGR